MTYNVPPGSGQGSGGVGGGSILPSEFTPNRLHNLNPTRVVARRGRDSMIIGALLLLSGLVGCGIGGFTALIGITVIPVVFLAIGGLILAIGLGFLIRGLTVRRENEPALAIANILERELDGRFSLLRNVSRRGLGYVDAILLGPTGAMVFRLVDKPGNYSNEGADWLERRGGTAFELSRLNATRECITDVYALRDYFGKRGLSNVPVFGTVCFTAPDVQLTARQPTVPIADLRTLMIVLRREYLTKDRVDGDTVARAVTLLYQ